MSLHKFSAALSDAFERHVYGHTPNELYEPIHYIMSLGGKRFRPLLTLASSNLFTNNWETALKPAMGVELFHNFTLMHDDIMDQATIRRGKETVHQKWDTNRAILSGDVMLVAAYELFIDVEDGNLREVFKRFNKTAAEVCEGQQLDMLFADKSDVTKEDYLEMIRLKTSVLVGFAMELGGIIGGADAKTCEQLYLIGENMGLGFQQMDDVLDVYADPEKFGKKVGGDIIENKKTWLALRAFEKAEGTHFEKDLMGWYSVEDEESKVKGVRAIFDIFGIKQEAEDLAEQYFAKAEKGILELPTRDTQAKELLLQILTLIRNRDK